MKYGTFIAVALLLAAADARGQVDSQYVRPHELEDGYGLHWMSAAQQDIPSPKNEIGAVSVSYDGRYVAYTENEQVKIFDRERSMVLVLSSAGVGLLWHPNRPLLLYTQAGVLRWQLWDGATDSRSEFPQLPVFVASMMVAWAADGNLYFPDLREDDASQRSLLRVHFDSTMLTGVVVIDTAGSSVTTPLFPPASTDFFITPLTAREEALNGFVIASGEGYRNRREVRIAPPDTTWEFSAGNSWLPRMHHMPIVLGDDGSVYLSLTFRHRGEKASLPFDSASLAARNASGIYRVDTSGNGLVQVVRSWTANLGIGIDRSGEQIFYGFLKPDSSISVFRMTRFGHDKSEVVGAYATSAISERQTRTAPVASLMPNPAGQEARLRIRGLRNPSRAAILYDVMGVAVGQSEAIEVGDGFGEYRFDVRNLSNGMYFCRVQSEQGAVTVSLEVRH